MEYKLKAYTIWDCGKRVDAEGKPHQEDSIYPAHQKATDHDRLFILCDGMGGHEAGEVASATVCEAMSKSIFAAAPNAEGEFTDEMLTQALADAYDALDTKDDGTATKKMGTTMTLLKLHNKGCTIAHIGDSRVYHVRPGKTAQDTTILFRTEDHSLVNDLVKAGELTPEEAKLSKQKNVITRAMQPLMEHRPKADVYHSTDIRPGDYFYLCSDGMLENMVDEQLCYFFSEEAGSDEHKVKSLMLATQENSDNHSAIIVHITDVLHPIVEAPADFQAANAPLMGEVHNNAAPREANSNMSAGSKRRSSKGLAGLVVFLCVCLVVAATIMFYPKPAAPKDTAEPEELLDGKGDKSINKSSPPIYPPATPAPTGKEDVPALAPAPATPAALSETAADTSNNPAPQVVSEEKEEPATDSIAVTAPTKEILEQAAKAAEILSKDKETNDTPPSEETMGEHI